MSNSTVFERISRLYQLCLETQGDDYFSSLNFNNVIDCYKHSLYSAYSFGPTGCLTSDDVLTIACHLEESGVLGALDVV